MKKKPLALGLALLTLVGPASLVAARPDGDRGGDHGGPRRGAINGVVTSVDAAATSFVIHLQGERGRRSQVQDVTVHTDAKTTFSLGEGAAGSFADVVVNARAVVKGTLNTDGSVQAQQVLLKAARPPRQAEVKGVIDAIDAATTSFILAAKGGRDRNSEPREVLVKTDASTVFKNEDGSAAAFEALAEGSSVEARGTLNEDGSFQAASVTIEGEEEPHPVQLRGVVASVDAKTSSFTLQPGGPRTEDRSSASLVVHTDENTTFAKADGTAAGFADVIVGARVAVEGARDGEGSLLAASVKIAAPEPPREVAIAGIVAAVAPDTASFVIQPGGRRENSADEAGVVIHTTDGTVFTKADGTAATFADVTLNARVAVKGVLQPDRSLIATQVVISATEPPREERVMGVVLSVDAEGHSFTIRRPGRSSDPRDGGSEVVVHTDAATVFTKGDAEATFADVAINGGVGCRGTFNADGSFQATAVVILVRER